MNSLFDHPIWAGQDHYVTAQSDFLHHQVDPNEIDLGQTCLVIFSSSLYKRVLTTVSQAVEGFQWPYSTTPLSLCQTEAGTKFALHFPSYGGTRIANSLEQLAACGVKWVFGLGLGGTLQDEIAIGDIVLLEGSVRGDGVSRYYAPQEYPAVADFDLVRQVSRCLETHQEPYHLGLSFGTDALYREEAQLIASLKQLQVVSIDLESSAFLTVGRRLGLRCCWVGAVSDRLVKSKHEGNIHSDHVAAVLTRLSGYLLDLIDLIETPSECANASVGR